MAETPAELRPSMPPRAKPWPSDAPERVFCRSSSLPSSSPAWRSSSAVQPMIGLCDDIVAARDQAGTNAVLRQVRNSGGFVGVQSSTRGEVLGYIFRATHLRL